ncbi:MAG: hypothetical protein JRE70_15090 [Deltaproteobacteria bacterium]|nr:hypothetical protein [Deltaproteobacteria bacterium]
MIQIKARNRRRSRSTARFRNAELGQKAGAWRRRGFFNGLLFNGLLGREQLLGGREAWLEELARLVVQDGERSTYEESVRE